MKELNNKKGASSKARSAKHPWVIAAVVVLVALAIGYFIYSFFYTLTNNRAADIAKPLGKALESKGAVKECENGDAGRGPDNRGPHYGVTYALAVDRSQAVSIMYDVTKTAGYNPVHASPSNRGFLGAVADEYIDKWYFDDTSKASPYGDMNAGNVRLSLVVHGEGDKDECTQSAIPAGHSTIGIGVQLPDYK